MSSDSANFGTTLSDGIQDISALLPLLGTEQVERHVGSSLEKGYLYAGASTLSLFGSLGSAKAAFATFLGTIVHPRFYGGRWLDDAGFGTAGSVTSMVTIDKDTGLYGAEARLKKLLEEQHIDDPNLVSGFEWSGWGRLVPEEKGETPWDDGFSSYQDYWREIKAGIGSTDPKKLTRDVKAMGRKALYSWNVQLIITSTLCAIVSGSPYLYLASSNWNNPLSWTYPALRSIGSFLCAVCIQLALQLRIHRITDTSLEWLKVRRKGGDVLEGLPGQKLKPLEQRIHEYIRPAVPEEGRGNAPDDELQRLEALLAIDPMLTAYQLLIATGMVMIVAGYVGCFSIVKNSNAPAGPYVWFAMEAILSLLRMVLWGLNPTWDESTGLTMKLKLHISNDPYFPLITSPHNSEGLGFKEKIPSPKPFAVYNEAEFFSAATSWIGPIQRLGANAITLYYAILSHNTPPLNDGANRGRKDLSITILLSDSRSFTFLCHGRDPEVTVFSSRLSMHSATGSSYYRVLLGDQINQANDGFLRSQLFQDVLRHAQSLRARMFRDSQDSMRLKWNLYGSEAHFIADGGDGGLAPLSKHDGEYIRLGQLWDFISSYIQNRRSVDKLYDILCDDTIKDIDFYREVLVIFESAILEAYLWIREKKLLDSYGGDQKLALQIYPECFQAMEERMAMLKTAATSRYRHQISPQSEPGILQLETAWTHLHGTLQSLRTYAAVDNDIQRMVKERCDIILGRVIGQEAQIRELVPYFLHPLLHPCFHDRIPETGWDVGLLITQYFDARHAYASVSLAHLSVSGLKSKPNLRALQLVLCSRAKREPRRYLAFIKYPDQEDDQAAQMTTLIFHYFNKESADLKAALADHITEHPQILCLAGTVCHQPGEDCDEPQCTATVANQEAWKNGMEKGLVFGYRVGFEGCPGGDVEAKGDYIQLHETGRCLIFFYCPGRGQITVTLSVRYTKAPRPTKLKATLQSDIGGISLTETRDVPAREDELEGELEDLAFSFRGMKKGTGRIAISRDWGNTWEIYGHVELKWRSNGPV